MKKLLLTFLIIATTINLKAQMWCAPGATWKYTFNGYMSNGYTELNYVSDTIISGITCKKINQRFKGMYFLISSTNTVDISINNHFIYENNKVVRIFSNSAFDTLYNFNANVGDKWRVVRHPAGSMCWPSPRKIAEVIDTGHITLNSVWLKKLVIKCALGSGTSTIVTIDTVCEKIGSKKLFLFPFSCAYGIIDPDFSDFWQPFRCYNDNTFGLYQAPGITSCTYLTGQKESQLEDKITLFPNPTSDKLFFEIRDFPIDDLTITIFNVLGEELRNEKITKNNQSIDLASLKSGIYFVSISTGNVKRFTKKIVKN